MILSTISPRGARSVVLPLGAQRPRLELVPDFVSSSGDEAVELAAAAGLVLDEWQQHVLRAALGERGDGKWSAPTVGLVVGRQNGKGSVLEARELWGLFLGGEELILHTAHRQKIATNHFRRMRKLIRALPAFEERVAKMPEGKGTEAIELFDGRRIEFVTRQSGNARGLTADLVVFDEAMFLSDDDNSAMSPTMAALSMHGNPQTWMVGSAVDQMEPSHNGVPFARIRNAALAGAPQIAFFEWSVPGDDPSRVPADVAADPEAQALANPGAGIRISYEWIEQERLVRMSARGFAVERLGVGDWPDPSEDSGRVISREDWAAAADSSPASVIKGVPTFAVDVNTDQTWGSVAMAGKRADGLFVVLVVAHERGPQDWLVGRCVELRREFPRAKFVIDRLSTAAAHISQLQAAKVRVVETTMQEYGRACVGFKAAVREHRLRYPDPQPELDDALIGALAKTMGDAWKWDKRHSTSADISPLVAATLAFWGAEQAKTPKIF